MAESRYSIDHDRLNRHIILNPAAGHGMIITSLQQ
jgi:hypothetical protein